ncbi:MAG TPA: TetR/AcrR family transcriptional regulator [Actinophytocola sp.]|uniref:TetR/AcrR family transcriptional regulator n=1 Tax=Actinophytocola sp. TaxID=1872138 RepID=UPI002DBCA050|nr:TetR/AcrR family transcriptional regulator [Actinophytocola sp.]HEU5471461.1 TetR/AcrR family transcriptional regulator [Actinophytocola sp.]
MTVPAPRWRRLEPDQRRQQILACAIKLFGERPYSAVSTTELAREAGVARGLINHYFGTKRDLYLEVVRRMVTMPEHAVRRLPKGSLEQRVDGAVTWFLDMVSLHPKTWLAAIGAEGVGDDPEVDRILAEADDIAAERILEAVDLANVVAHREELRAMIRSYGALVKAAAREWLVRETMPREHVQLLLANTLLAILRDTFPAVRTSPAQSR